MAAVRVEPPAHQVADGPLLRVERSGHEAEALPLDLELLLLQLGADLRLRSGLARDGDPGAGRVLVLEAPAALVREHRPHGSPHVFLRFTARRVLPLLATRSRSA